MGKRMNIKLDDIGFYTLSEKRAKEKIRVTEIHMEKLFNLGIEKEFKINDEHITKRGKKKWLAVMTPNKKDNKSSYSFTFILYYYYKITALVSPDDTL